MQQIHFLYKIFLGIILFLSPEITFSQQYPFRIYNEENGLTQTTVEVIFQDSKGYLWIGTHGGASRFDGISFKDYTTKEGLLSNRLYDITEDMNGNIWFATNSGITINNGSDFFSLTDTNGLPSNTVYCFLKNKAGLIIGTSKGACIVNSSNVLNQTKIQVETFLGDLSGRKIKKLFEDSRGRLWIGTDSGLVYQNNSEWIYLTKERGISHNEIFSIAEDADNNIWCGSHAGYSKIILDGQREIITIESKNTSVNGKDNPVRAILCDTDRKIYLGIPFLTILQKSDGNRFGYIEDESYLLVNGINSNGIHSIFKDREGNFWFGGAEQGISTFPGKIFQSYTTNFGASGNSIRGITKDKAGNIWLATNSAISKFKEPQSKFFTSDIQNFITKIDREKGLPISSAWSILTDISGNVWFGGVGGLFKYDGQKFESFSSRKDFNGDVVMRIYQDKKNVLWFLSFSGVTCYDPQKDSLYNPFDEKSPFFNKRIKTIYHHSNGDYWFGSTNGLTCLHSGKYSQFTTKEGLPDNYVALIIPDKMENLWLATGKGISKFDGKNFYNINAKDGLSSDTPYLLIFDNDNNLWVGTNKGLDKIIFNEKNEIAGMKFYGKDEGFLGVETNANAAFKDEKGDLWFGTMKGAIHYQKKYERVNSVEPSTVIEKLTIDYTDYPLVKNMSLSYDRTHLSFYYKAICLTNPKKVKYKFRLVNFDTQWSPETKETYTTYSNLPPGDYTFEVIACNNDNIWNKNPTSFHFVIEPPFWRTYWFYFLCLATFLLCIYLYVKWKTLALEEAKKTLKDKVEERTRELSVQNKKLESANVEILKNKAEIENKNKDITDSITYAKRIQDAILPSQKTVEEHFENVFILYKPKDIVAGDFYWIAQASLDSHEVGTFTQAGCDAPGQVHASEIVFIAAADCTGHGVPGALVSVVCSNALNRAVKEFGLRDTGKILDKVTDLVLETFEKSGSGVKDGMDISLLAINKTNKTIQWSGANNPLWYVQDGKIKVIKADKQPIGKFDIRKPFTTYTIEAPINPPASGEEKNNAQGGGNEHCKITPLESGEPLTFYLFTDGLPDQFGGPKGKKLMYRRFQENLNLIHHLPMEEQKIFLEKSFTDWKGGLEQVDDITVIGVKV